MKRATKKMAVLEFMSLKLCEDLCDLFKRVAGLERENQPVDYRSISLTQFYQILST